MISRRNFRIGCILLFLVALDCLATGQSTLAAVAPPATAASGLHTKAFAAAQDSFQKDLQLAKRGDSQAELRVARAYFLGAGRTRDTAEAFKWFQAAAQQKPAEANAWIGECYLQGRGVSRDVTLGAKLITGSAAQGDPQGLIFLGTMYETGIGAELDFAKAADLYRRAAESHNGNAMARLGYLYLQGNGVPQDRAKAIDSFTKGAALGDSWAELLLAQVKLRNESSPNYSEIVSLLDDAAAKGSGEASFLLGSLYQRGQGVPENDVQAVLYFQHSAHRGNVKAERELGKVYEFGTGAPADLARAYVLYSLAADQDDSLAAEALTSLVPKMSPELLQRARDSLNNRRNGTRD